MPAYRIAKEINSALLSGNINVSHCAKNRIYAIVYFAYISSIRMNIRVRIREISHWYILRIEPISHCVYFEYPQMYHVRLWRIL